MVTASLYFLRASPVGLVRLHAHPISFFALVDAIATLVACTRYLLVWAATYKHRGGCLGRQDAIGNYRDLFLMLRVQLFRGVSRSCLGGGASWAWVKDLQGLGRYGGSAAPLLGDLSFKRPHSESPVTRISTLLR
jgi:hypothetical protein